MPADRKWAMRALVAQVILMSMRKLDLHYPAPDDEKREAIKLAIRELRNET
jgi:hypothetical protein